MIGQCDEFKKLAHDYERNPKSQYHAVQAGETERWYAQIHQHFNDVLLPEIKSHAGELFVEYWPAYFVVDRVRELRQGISNDVLFNYEFGSHGTGYVCVTSRALRLVVIEQLTKQFPLYKSSLTGFVLDAISKQMNRLRPFQGDYTWSLSPSQIQTVSISASGRGGSERIRLVTDAGTWEVFEHFTDQRKEILRAVECLRSGAFVSLRPKSHVTKKPRVLSDTALQNHRRYASPSVSLLPSAPDEIRASRGAKMLDLHHFAAEVSGRGGSEVELDLAHAVAMMPNNRSLGELRSVFARIRHLLDLCTTESELLDTLLLQIDRAPELTLAYRECVERLGRPYLKSTHPLPERPHPALIRTIEIGQVHTPENTSPRAACWTWGCDTNVLFTGGYNGIVRVWDLSAQAVKHSFQAYLSTADENRWKQRIEQLVLSPNGDLLVSISAGGELKTWNTRDWSLRFTFVDPSKSENSRSYCAFDASGDMLAYNDDQSRAITILDVETGKPIPHSLTFEAMPGENENLGLMRLSPTGDWVLAQIYDTSEWLFQRLAAFELATGDELFSVECFEAIHIGISPSGNRIIAERGPGTDIWDMKVGDWTHSLGRRMGWSFSPSGRLMASGDSDGQVLVHDAASGELIYTLPGHLKSIQRCEFSPDEQFLISADEQNHLKIWNLAKVSAYWEAPKPFFFPPEANKRHSCKTCNVIAISDSLLVGNPHFAAILDSHTGEVSPKYDSNRGARHVLEMHLNELRRLGIDRCAVSRSGKHVVLAGNDGWALFDTQQTNILFSYSAPYRFNSEGATAVSDDARWVALSKDDRLTIWDTSNGNEVPLSFDGRVYSCSFDPSCQWLVFSSGAYPSQKPNRLYRYDLHTQVCQPFDDPLVASTWAYSDKRNFAFAEWGYVRDCSVTKDGRQVLAAHSSGVVSVWDAQSLRLIHYWQAHDRRYPVTQIVCRPLPDGKTAMTVCDDCTVKLWEIATGTCITAVRTEGVLSDCDVFPDGKRLAAVGEAGVYWLEIAGLA